MTLNQKGKTMALNVLMLDTRSSGSEMYLKGSQYSIDDGLARMFIHHGFASLVSGKLVQNDEIDAKLATNASGNIIGIVGSSGEPIRIGNINGLIPFQSFVGSTKNKSVFNTAVAANAAKVAYVGHSIVAGNNQNFYGATTYNLLRRVLKEAFPTVAFTFENYGIGGTNANQFVTGNPATTIAAPSNNVYREFWRNDSGALTTNGSWADKVATFAPDLIFIQFDLNETSVATFATQMQVIIDNINSGARFSAKRPSIVLVSSHTGINNTAVVRGCHKVLRALAKKNQVPLIDGGRVYDILTTAIDPYDLTPSITGEFIFNGAVASGQNLNSSLFESKIGTAFSPTGVTIRDSVSGANLRFYRNKLSKDGANQQEITINAVGGIASLFYRADPLDANYATGTGKQYEIRITTTTVQAFYWPAGSAVAISGATVTLTNGTGTSTKFQMRAEYKGAEHKVTIYAPNGEVKSFEFTDFQRLDDGYNGMGYSGVSGGFFSLGTLGNVSAGYVIEYWDNLQIGIPTYTDADLVGAVNDFTTNQNSVGGNAINHLTNLGTKLVYEPAIFSVVRQLQSS
jgi:hypothetical protein